MKLSFKFNNLLGSIYHKGNLLFSPDGNNVFSPIGNKIAIFDVKNGKCEAIPIETEYNVSHMTLSPNGALLLASSEKTHLYMISLISGIILHRKEFRDIGETINDLQFSPDGKYYVVCGSSRVLIYLTPGFAVKGRGRQVSPFKIHKMIKLQYDDACCVSWSGDSTLLAIGSKDYTLKIYPIDRSLKKVPSFINLAGHSDHIVNCFFANSLPNELNLYSLSRNGHLFVWEANIPSYEQLSASHQEEINDNDDDDDDELEKLNYRKLARHYFSEHLKENSSNASLSCSNYHSKSKLLVAGFTNGAFLLFEMPEFTLIHSLQLSTHGGIDSLVINNSGDWIAIGSSIGSGNKFDTQSDECSQSQLIIWEWQSESFVLKQSGTGAGVTNIYECICYSPDATLLASGGTDGRIKIWNTLSNFCIATFAEEHKGPITAIEFVTGKNGKVLLSSSLDGTIRAFDLNRYRNFRTLAAPAESKPAQFISLAVDTLGGDFVAAGAHNFFEIFLWSLQTGRLLECLTGHEAPVSGLSFSPVSNSLVSCSWDRSIRIWDLFEGAKCTREMIRLGSDALRIAFRPDGNQFAVSTLNGYISFFNPYTGEENGSAIEGKDDLGISQYDDELSRDREKYFSSLHYSADGSHIIAAGKSKNICIYHAQEKLLVKKFSFTFNLSMDGMFDYISKRKVAEFGFNMSKIEERNEENQHSAIALPGVTKSDFSSRSVNPTIAAYSVRFSPTMRSFAVATTEGILVYSIDNSKTFDPYQLEIGITPNSVKAALNEREYCDALMQALKLNEKHLIQEVLQRIPVSDIQLVSNNLPLIYVEKCLRSIAVQLEDTPHLQFYLKWCQMILYQHGTALKNQLSIETLIPTFRLVQQNVSRHYENIGKICEHNKYVLEFIKIMGHHRKNNEIKESEINGHDMQDDQEMQEEMEDEMC